MEFSKKEITKKTVICIKCNNTTDSTISYRSTRRSRTVYFCSQNCHDNFRKENECIVCRNSSCEKEIMPDGFVVCSDNLPFIERPTCKQKYTGFFMCDFCNKESNGNMYVVQNDSCLYDSCFGKNDGDKNESYIPTILLCNECHKPYKSNESSYHYLESKKYPKIHEINENSHPHYRYIVASYKSKVNLSNKETKETKETKNIVKDGINKLFEENKIVELNEIYDFIKVLLEK